MTAPFGKCTAFSGPRGWWYFCAGEDGVSISPTFPPASREEIELRLAALGWEADGGWTVNPPAVPPLDWKLVLRRAGR